MISGEILNMGVIYDKHKDFVYPFWANLVQKIKILY